MNHDHCYDDAVNRKFCYDTPEEYVDEYTWSCAKNGTPICEGQLTYKNNFLISKSG